MKHLGFLILLIILGTNSNAQETELISGTWVFSKVLNEDIDENSLTYLNSQVLGKWVFIFKKDGTFESPALGNPDGQTWKYDSDNKTITVSNAEGITQEFIVLKSTRDELSLNLGTGKFLLKRVN